jgi:hypothetical protein
MRYVHWEDFESLLKETLTEAKLTMASVGRATIILYSLEAGSTIPEQALAQPTVVAKLI